MKNLAYTLLIAVIVAMALRLGYVQGYGRGWHLAHTEHEFAKAFAGRVELTPDESPATTIDRAWRRSVQTIEATDAAWCALPMSDRFKITRPLWQQPQAPKDFADAVMKAKTPPPAPPPPKPGRLSELPFSGTHYAEGDRLNPKK